MKYNNFIEIVFKISYHPCLWTHIYEEKYLFSQSPQTFAIYITLSPMNFASNDKQDKTYSDAEGGTHDVLPPLFILES